MNAQPEPPVSVPTPDEVRAAKETLLEGLMAVHLGTWNKDMQPERDRARGIVNRARDAGVI